MEKTIDDLVLESARIGVQIRKKMKTDTCNYARRYYTYVLLLENRRFYIGSSNNIYIRLMEHIYDTDMSSLWVKEHGPVVRVLEIIRNSAPDDETYKTLEYMTVFGWESVRGAGWCKLEMKSPPPALFTFQRNRCDFDYLSRKEIDDVLQLSLELYNTMTS